MVGAGVLGTALGLLVIAARLAVDRRRAELRLLRARGASRARLMGTVGVESLAVVLPAVAAGWLHHLVPGRPDPPSVGALWPVAAAALLAVAAVPLAVLVTRHEASTAQRRTDLILRRPAPQRVTVEVTVLLLAVLGVLLLRRRGLAVAGSDPYLSAVPLLIGAAAGLVALHAYPWPVRLLTRLSNRRRVPVAFLGLARAGRHATAFALPLVVLVLAVSLAGFAAAVRGGVADARGMAAALEVGADFRLTAPAFAPGVEQAVAGSPACAACSPPATYATCPCGSATPAPTGSGWWPWTRPGTSDCSTRTASTCGCRPRCSTRLTRGQCRSRPRRPWPRCSPTRRA